jgi:CheY-like chemotaxis protein
MWLESEIGVGSTFGFSLPAFTDDVLPQGSEGSPTVGDVVVIEDDRPSLDLLTAYLLGIAEHVTTARDGPAGLAAVRRVRPGLVLLDIRLPGIDGWAVLEALKSDAATRHIPVVVVSIVEERGRGAALGADAYVVKPVSRDALLGVLADIGVIPPSTEGVEVS